MVSVNSWLRLWAVAASLLAVVGVIETFFVFSLLSITVMYWVMWVFLIIMGWLIYDLKRDE